MIAYPPQLAKISWNLCGTTRASPWVHGGHPPSRALKGRHKEQDVAGCAALSGLAGSSHHRTPGQRPGLVCCAPSGRKTKSASPNRAPSFSWPAACWHALSLSCILRLHGSAATCQPANTRSWYCMVLPDILGPYPPAVTCHLPTCQRATSLWCQGALDGANGPACQRAKSVVARPDILLHPQSSSTARHGPKGHRATSFWFQRVSDSANPPDSPGHLPTAGNCPGMECPGRKSR